MAVTPVSVTNLDEVFEHPIAIDQSASGWTNGVVEMGGLNSAFSSITSLASSQTLMKANPNRKGGFIASNSTALLYVFLGDGPASTTRFSFVLGAGSTTPTSQALPPGYRGAVQGIWVSANGTGFVTEIY